MIRVAARILTAAVLVASMLSGCGGTRPGAEGTTRLVLTLSVRDAQGGAVGEIRAGERVRAQARVERVTTRRSNGRIVDESRSPVPGVIVELSTGGGALEPANGRVATDAQGTATASLIAGNETGAFELTGEVTEGDEQASDRVVYTVTEQALGLSLRLRDGQGREVSELTEGESVTVQARATRASDDGPEPVAEAIVELVTAGGQLSPENGRVLTDADGRAEATLTPGNVPGAFELAAAVMLDDREASASINYQVRRAPRPRVQLAFVDPASGEPLPSPRVEAGQQVRVRARLERPTEQPQGFEPVAGGVVTFSTDGGVLEPTSGRALTNDQGIAAIDFEPSFDGGAFVMAASATVDDRAAEGRLSYEVTIPELVLGTGEPLRPGELGIATNPVAAGGSTALSVRLRRADGGPWEPTTDVRFTSPCIVAGLAEVRSPVAAIGGVAETTYRAQGCRGRDPITASASVRGRVFDATAEGELGIEPPEAGAIELVEVDPPLIALRGAVASDLPERARVRFRVRNDRGVPVPNTQVTMSLSSAAGGVDLEPRQAISDQEGIVETVVRSGSVATVVRVTARVEGSMVSTQSGQITISTGVPDQDSMSLAAETLNVEGLRRDGETSELTLRAGDRFNNLAPDGTRIQFIAEGGSVPSSCVLDDGACSVTWTTQNPRPADGRVTILAHTVGDESFTDTNGNGVFDGPDTFEDLPEAFRDDNENGQRDNLEPFIDSDGDRTFDLPNGRYDGLLCEDPVRCGNSGSVNVRAQTVLVMASSRASIEISPRPIRVNEAVTQDVEIAVADVNGNQMPRGTTIDIEADAGTFTGPDTVTVGNTNAPGPLVTNVRIGFAGVDEEGVLRVEVTSPSGEQTVGEASIMARTLCDGFAPVPDFCEEEGDDGGG